MKKLVNLFFVLLLVTMALPIGVMAQDTTTDEPMGLLDALEIVAAEYDGVIVEIEYHSNADDSDDDSADDSSADDSMENSYWSFEFADGKEVKIDALTGDIMVDDNSADDTSDDSDDMDDDSDDDSSDDDLSGVMPTVTIEEAIAKALEIFPNSVVSSIELEMWSDGTLVWDVNLDDGTRSVDVDATSGEALSFGYESQDDNSYQDDDSDDNHDDDMNDDHDDDHDDEHDDDHDDDHEEDDDDDHDDDHEEDDDDD